MDIDTVVVRIIYCYEKRV